MAPPSAECEQGRLEQVEQLGRQLQEEQQRMAVTFAQQIAGVEKSMADRIKAHETFVQQEFQKRMDEAEVGRAALKWISAVSELRSSLGAQKEAQSQGDEAQREARSRAEEDLAEARRTLGLQRELQQQAQNELARVMHLRVDIEKWWSSQGEAASASGAASEKASASPVAAAKAASASAPAADERAAAPAPGPGAHAAPPDEVGAPPGAAPADPPPRRALTEGGHHVEKVLEDQSLKLQLLQAQVDTLMEATPAPAPMVPGSASDLLAQFQECTNEDERRQLFETMLSQRSAELQPAVPLRPYGSSGQLSPGLTVQLRPVPSCPGSSEQLSSGQLSPGPPRGREEPGQAAGPVAAVPSAMPLEWARPPPSPHASAGGSSPIPRAQGQRSFGNIGVGAARASAPRAVENSGIAAVSGNPAPHPPLRAAPGSAAPRAVEGSGIAACSTTSPPPPSRDPAARGLAAQQGFSTVLAAPPAGYFALEPPAGQQHADAWAGQPAAVPWQAPGGLSGAHARQGHVVPYILSGAHRGNRRSPESPERTLRAPSRQAPE